MQQHKIMDTFEDKPPTWQMNAKNDFTENDEKFIPLKKKVLNDNNK